MSERNSSILVVEDDPALRDALCDTLQIAGYDVTAAADGSAALELCERTAFGVVVSDVQMRPMDGHELLAQLRGKRPDLPVVLMTAHGTIGKAVEAMRDGAADYLPKPFEAGTLIELVRRLLPAAESPTELVAEDPRMREVLGMARRIAATDVTVLITGESGTGKEVFARFIHVQSERRERPFIAINCAAIPENMLEAVLFGYEKGAFTGAQTAHAGKFEQAQGGTLLLDEISEMDLSLQAKLLRVLQEREVERLGGTRTISLDVRVLATSNRSLREEVAAGRFREDLYYRLNVVPLRLPALRERREDILPLVRRALARYAQPGTLPPALSADAEQVLTQHNWPGNVRELNNVIQRAAILATGATLRPEDLRFETADTADETAAPQPASIADTAVTAALGADLRERERALILEAIQNAPSRKEAAARLGISPRTLRHKLAQMRAKGLEVA
ncbi:MAG TPA: sigma-54 dependent transcriptional regulator [Steroidobacteraceae bacterium]|nr:sigma-54 dependent transcriptional regulator [Steroidobacteraceae bacterium]